MLAETDEDYRRIMYGPLPYRFHAGDVAKVGKAIVKILHVDGRRADIVMIEQDRIVYGSCATRDLTSLEVALGAKSMWVEMSHVDAIAIAAEEEQAKAAENERKRKAKKPKKSKRIK